MSNSQTARPIVLITGATSGIGRHAALTLARRGMRVFATGRREDRLADLAREATGMALETIVLDVTSPASIDSARAEILARTGGHGVDVLVNNAGYGESGPVVTVSDARLRQQFETNVFGLMAMTRAFLPEMRARHGGRIINVGSLGGTFTLPLFGAYNATKYALESLSDALRMELSPLGIKVSLIQPGTINTEFTPGAVSNAAGDSDDPAYAAALASLQKMEKMAEKTGVGPECTSRAIYRAATARRPRARYATPWFAAWSVSFLRWLPTSWRDALLRRAVGLTRQRMLTTSETEALTAAEAA